MSNEKLSNEAQNPTLRKGVVGGSASAIISKILHNHFGTSQKSVEVRFYDSGIYQYSAFYHTGQLAWAAGENWKMLSSSTTKTYEIVSD